MADSVIRFLFKGDAKGALDAFKQMDASAASMDQRMRAFTRATVGLNVGLGQVAFAAGAAAVAKVARFAAGGLEAADAMAKLSRRLGVTVEDLAAYRRAAELSGTTQEAVAAAFERMNRTFGDAARGSVFAPRAGVPS